MCGLLSTVNIWIKRSSQEVLAPKLTVEEILDYMDVDNKYSWSRSGNVITITDKLIK